LSSLPNESGSDRWPANQRRSRPRVSSSGAVSSGCGAAFWAWPCSWLSRLVYYSTFRPKFLTTARPDQAPVQGRPCGAPSLAAEPAAGTRAHVVLMPRGSAGRRRHPPSGQAERTAPLPPVRAARSRPPRWALRRARAASQQAPLVVVLSSPTRAGLFVSVAGTRAASHGQPGERLEFAVQRHHIEGRHAGALSVT